MTIDGDERAALLVDSDVEVRFRGIEVKPGAVLEVGVAVQPSRPESGRDGVLFRVFWQNRGARRLLYSQYVDPGRRPDDRRWFDARVPLSRLGPVDAELARGTLVLATAPGMREASVSGGALWARPRIVYPWREPAVAPDERPNVVLISLDTLRADHLGAYGYDRPTSPHIDAWAATAATFLQAQAPANATLDSHMSIMTAVYPDVHDVRARSHAASAHNPAITSGNTLDRRWITLAETLRGEGYETAAFVRDVYWMKPQLGFAQGFDLYRAVNANAARMNRAHVFPWLEQHRDERFFLFLHYYDIHSDWTKLPYDSPAAQRAQLVPEYTGAFTGCGGGACASGYLQKLDRGHVRVPPADLEYISALYDSGIAFMDEQFAALLEKLRALDLMERTMIVLFADHGEEFREHGQFLHGQLYQEIVGVPLIIGYPGVIPPRHIEVPVQTMDIMPTVLDTVGAPLNGEIQGRSLLPLIHGHDQDGALLFSTHANGRLYAVRDGDWKLIVDRHTGTQELYELGDDASERRDVSTLHPERAARLRAALEAWTTDNARRKDMLGEGPAGESRQRMQPDAAELERLRRLGYVE